MRHVRVGKDNTTITLEDEFWEQLRIIAVTRNVAISQLLAEIDRTMRLQPARPGYSRVRTLSAAVRVFVLQTLTSPPSNAGRHARGRSHRSPWSLPRGMHPSKAVRIASAPGAQPQDLHRSALIHQQQSVAVIRFSPRLPSPHGVVLRVGHPDFAGAFAKLRRQPVYLGPDFIWAEVRRFDVAIDIYRRAILAVQNGIR